MASQWSRVGIRLAFWLPLTGLALVYYLWGVNRTPPAMPPPPSPSTQAAPIPASCRPATSEEWALPIVELGRRKLARQVGFRPGLVIGRLVWWHDGLEECLTYEAAPGEDAEQSLAILVPALFEGRVQTDEPDLAKRIPSLINRPLPAGFVILQAPAPAIPRPATTVTAPAASAP